MNVNLKDELVHVKSEVVELLHGIESASSLLVTAISECDIQKFESAKDYIKNVTTRTTAIDNEVIKILALHSPEARDLRETVAYFKITNELLRASTGIRSFIKGFVDLCSDVDITIVREYAVPMQKATTKALNLVKTMIVTDCLDEIQEYYDDALIEESKTDDLFEMLEKKLLDEAVTQDNINKFELYHNLLRTLRKGEKIADRALSIAHLILYARLGGTIHK
ncbi:MAG: hypothetical protein IE909_03255 [Campylobacterales bacterium]|nr:hypothetical protein [Campylobacterales bacterium]